MVRVNKLFVSFFLNLSQVKNMYNSKAGVLMLPDNLDHSILFTEDDLNTLNQNRDLLIRQTGKSYLLCSNPSRSDHQQKRGVERRGEKTY